MKLRYYPETDSLYIEFQNRPGTTTQEISEGIVLDIDDKGNPVGLDIDHASKNLDLAGLEAINLPLKTAPQIHNLSQG